MPDGGDWRDSAAVWHGFGLIGVIAMLGLYGTAGLYLDHGNLSFSLFAVLSGAATVCAVGACIGWVSGWQGREGLLWAWPVAAMVVTLGVGIVEPAVTRALPGTITIAFVFTGLTHPPGSSVKLLPLAVAAFVVGGQKTLPAALPSVVAAAVMWVLIAEVPARLVARLKRQSELLRAMASTDPLTQLRNRTTLARQLSAHADDAMVVLIDLDNFKQYNDRYGHEAGDAVLVRFAEALRACVRGGDVIFRIGGDEFLLLLVGADHDKAQAVCAQLRQLWAQTGSTIGFSAGIASGTDDPLVAADEQMYRDKQRRKESD